MIQPPNSQGRSTKLTSNRSSTDAQDPDLPPSVRLYTGGDRAKQWLRSRRGQQPLLACILGFTETGLIPDISAAGATPADRRYTALADAEFLVNGPRCNPRYPLPPLVAGASPVLISRAVVESLRWRVRLFDAGLPDLPSVPATRLGGVTARCLSTGQALDRAVVEQLFAAGLRWGERLFQTAPVPPDYLLIAECVVGGTSTALAVLLGLGVDAANRVNSSHVQCNHDQKLTLALQGLQQASLGQWDAVARRWQPHPDRDPLAIVAAVGDPMQPVAAGMALAASQRGGALLAGGTQMLAVYALAQAIAHARKLSWNPAAIAVGTTPWVVNDPTADAVGLARAIGSDEHEPILLASQLDFGSSHWAQLRAYEAGFVKEGVGAGGAAIAASCGAGWTGQRCLRAIESLLDRWSGIVHSL